MGTVWVRVLELVQEMGNELWHKYVDVLFLVVPFNGESKVF